MKKQYNSPEIEIERFLFEDILTTSGGIGYGDAVEDTLDSDTDEPVG